MGLEKYVVGSHAQLSRACAVIVLVVVVLWVYWPVQQYDFVNYDDQGYVSGNRQIRLGLSVEGLKWAFTDLRTGHWHPLTWLSHMLDYQLYLLNPGGHHWTNAILHLINTLLLLGILARMTGLFWRSMIVASLFALHPLNVESVAWISERKNVLSTFFWMVTLWAYLWYVLSPGVKRYVWVLSAFGLGLLAKPMLVTLPFVLLLIDFWPLRRWRIGGSMAGGGLVVEGRPALPATSFFHLLVEKIPLFILAVLSSIMTINAAKYVNTVATIDKVPLGHRLMTAAVSYAEYVGKTIWPHDLTVFYPYVQSWPAWQVGGAFLLILGVSGAVLLAGRKAPYLPVGWFWYLGTLVPVIGLVQAGDQAMADRYAYIPLIGLFIVLAWGLSEGSAGWRFRKILLLSVSGLILLGLTAATANQLPVWQNSITLFEHALKVTRNNRVAQTNLGAALVEAGRPQEAIAHYEAAMRIRPEPEFHINIGVALMHAGRLDEAMAHYRETLKERPDYAKAYNNIGVVLGKQGKLEEAIGNFERALELKPDYADAYNNLGFAMAQKGRHGEAISHYAKSLRYDPDNPKTYCNMGIAFLALGRPKEAAVQIRAALELDPENAEIYKLLRHAESVGEMTGIQSGIMR